MEAEAAVDTTTEGEVCPWDRLPGENNKNYTRFVAYLEQGAKRNVLQTYNAQQEAEGKSKKKSPPKSWSDAFHAFHWDDRAAAYDAFQRAEKARRDAELQKKEQAMFLEMRKQQVQDETAVARKLLLKAHDLLEMPVERVKEEVEDEAGNTIKIIVPDHNCFKTAASLVKQYSETSRLALGMPTQHARFDVKKLSTEDLLTLYNDLVQEEEALEKEDESEPGE